MWITRATAPAVVLGNFKTARDHGTALKPLFLPRFYFKKIWTARGTAPPGVVPVSFKIDKDHGSAPWSLSISNLTRTTEPARPTSTRKSGKKNGISKVEINYNALL